MMDRTLESIFSKFTRSKNLQRWALAFVIIASAFLYTGLKFFHVLDAPIHYFENQAFQLRSAFFQPPQEIKKIAMIDVDDESLWKIRRSWPFSNEIHADFLRKLSAYHPELIIFNFMFVNKEDPEGKKALVEAIQDAGNVILANRLTIAGNHIIQKTFDILVS